MARFNIQDYVDVQTRINQFWKDWPDGRIVTHVISDPDVFDRVVVRAEVYKHRDHPHPDSADIAAEEKGQGGMANATSWHENASTSAIGRALANMGYAKSGADRPSRQEMEKVVRHEPTPLRHPQPVPPGDVPRPQAGPGQITDKQVKYLFGLASEVNPDKGVSGEAFLHGQMAARFPGVAHVHELTRHQASQLVDWFKARDFIDAAPPPGPPALIEDDVPVEPEWLRNQTWQ